MPDEHRILDLLEQILDLDCSPEEVCSDAPELLEEVRQRLARLRLVQGQVEELFPSSKAGLSRKTTSDADFPRISGYEIEAVLGRGGMGIVYRARHEKLNRTVALKMMLSGQYASPLEMLRFVREAEAIATLQHPNIVQVYDVGELDGKPYFTMEYLEGGSVAQNLEGTPWSTERSARLVAVLANAVEFAHQHKIVHRDLKPANILLTKDCVPKIVDFGLARRIDGIQELTLSGARIGTPSYMAPEQAKGQRDSVCPSVDIYALGSILYELLTGRPPFRGETAAETLHQLIFHDPASPSQLNPGIPRDLETICLKCLAKEPERRYTSAAVLAEDLSRYLGGHPILARPMNWLGRFTRWGRRNPAAAALWATALTFAISACGGGYWFVKQAAAKRADDARQERETIQKVEAALSQSAVLQGEGRWPESGAVLKGLDSLLDARTPDALRQRLIQTIANAEMVANLEEIRLRLSDGRKTPEAAPLSPEKLYADAFRNHGLDILALKPAVAVAIIDNSAIRETLLAYLHDWLHWVSEANRPFLQAVLDTSDKSDWRRAFRKALASNDAAKLRELARSSEAQSQSPVVLSGLGGALRGSGDRDEAMALLIQAQQNHPQDFWINYLLGQFWYQDQPQIAVGYFRAAVAIRPTSDQAYAMLGRSLKDADDPDGAISAFRKVTTLNPNLLVAKDLAPLLAPRGELDEVFDAWDNFLERSPSEFESWYGYAQLALYLNRKDKYTAARTALLNRFGDTSDNWVTAERVSLACLLLPDSGSDFERTVALVDRAIDAAKKAKTPDNAYVTFAKGLADFRLGEFGAAIPRLHNSAEQLSSRPGPRLVLAMAQLRSGNEVEARKNLAIAVASYNWNPAQATHTTVWVSHVLRREAEAAILHDLEPFLQGNYQPADNDERLSLLGRCQYEGRTAACATLYADAFAADNSLADKLINDLISRALKGTEPNRDRIDALNTASRYLAARCAASAGCGLAIDGRHLNDQDRARWRRQALEWLQADLAIWTRLIGSESRAERDLAKGVLVSWQKELDFSGLRKPAALMTLSSEEAVAWAALWNQVAEALIID